MKRRKHRQGGVPQVLILHGLSQNIVDYLKYLLGSVGLFAETAIALPSLEKKQEDKVDHYIKSCGLPLIVVSRDEKALDSGKARLNVYDEIARCRANRRDDAIVLLEYTDGVPVELPSNIEGQLVTIPFDQHELHLLAPRLLKEVTSRDFVRGTTGPERTFEAGGTLNAFLDSMDDLWDNQFDEAWKKVHRTDYDAESNLTDKLDEFFQQYHKVISAFVRQKKRGQDLEEVCEVALAKALQCAAHAWEYVAGAKMKNADDINERLRRTKNALKHRATYDEASSELRVGRRSELPRERIAHFRKAIDLVDIYIQKNNI